MKRRTLIPRSGKPVKVNALWYNALISLAGFAKRLGEPANGRTLRRVN